MKDYLICVAILIMTFLGIGVCKRLDTLIELWTNAPVIEEEAVDWLVEPEPEDFLVV